MNFKKSQSGRSMVEMLGVLAIIGVLSVGGIAGYSLSMRRHRANQIADLASKYALIAYNHCQQKLLNGEVSLPRECHETAPTFEEAGIGSLPAGVTEFNSVHISNDPATGVDTVEICVNFSDKKLCETLGSIAGTGCGSTVVFMKIKQN